MASSPAGRANIDRIHHPVPSWSRVFLAGCVFLAACSHAGRWHRQHLSDVKNPYGYCNHGPNGLTCPVGVAKVSTVHD